MAQIAVNVGMNLRVLPVIGVTLPSTPQAVARCLCCISVSV